MEAYPNGRSERSSGHVEKLIEYRTAHYAAFSEAARYFTNTPARVKFRFPNPIICDLRGGTKTMRVGGSAAFELFTGDVMFVPPGLEIDVDLGMASQATPIECNCFEIETDRLEGIIARLNERMARAGNRSVAALNWSAFAVLCGEEARRLQLASLMELFCCERDVFADLRIDVRLDDAMLKLMQSRSSELLMLDHASEDTGIRAAAHLIRENLARHVPTNELARVAVTSEATLHRQFRKFFGTTPARFANRLRIMEAKRRLRQSLDPIEVLAFELGFSDASHFSREFRKTTGDRPVEYRKRHQQPANLLDW